MVAAKLRGERNGMEEDIQRSRAAGFATHLTKPIRIESLDHALAAIERK
jgi:CheY-like chemotaxis protein